MDGFKKSCLTQTEYCSARLVILGEKKKLFLDWMFLGDKNLMSGNINSTYRYVNRTLNLVAIMTFNKIF